MNYRYTFRLHIQWQSIAQAIELIRQTFGSVTCARTVESEIKIEIYTSLSSWIELLETIFVVFAMQLELLCLLIWHYRKFDSISTLFFVPTFADSHNDHRNNSNHNHHRSSYMINHTPQSSMYCFYLVLFRTQYTYL